MKLLQFVFIILSLIICDSTSQYLPSDWAERVLRELDQIDENIVKRESKKRCSAVNSEAVRWTEAVDAELRDQMSALSYANWNYLTNMTDSNAHQLELVQNNVGSWFHVKLPTARDYVHNADNICNSTTVRLLKLFVNYNIVPVTNNTAVYSRISQIVNMMQRIYSTTTVTDRNGQTYRLKPELTDIMATSRDYNQLKWAWQAWREAAGRPIGPLYLELVEKMNSAAENYGHDTIVESWQVADFGATDIEPMMDRLYEQILPLYRQLHAFVRRKLVDRYSSSGLNPTGAIPAHLLGDMWGQDWSNILDLLMPSNVYQHQQMDTALRYADYNPLKMFELAEGFFKSLAFELMTPDFWDKSIFVRPNDSRPIDCHASSHDFFDQRDFRIKMCAEVTASDLLTIHHEMGHIQYFMQYRHLPTLFRTSANAAFHEAVGDTVTMSVLTWQHFKTVVLPRRTSHRPRISLTRLNELHTGFLLKMALTKLAFLPFAYMLEKWRYHVFRREVIPAEYNALWWSLRLRFQGVVAPVRRTANDFDPGCKFHVASNIPYSRYFLSSIAQFQFHSALCRAKRHTGPLHLCDIYKSIDAGRRFMSMLKLGASRPWPEVMKIMTGQEAFLADDLLEYFKPLRTWLEAENKGQLVGW